MKKGFKWLIIVVMIILLVMGGYFIFSSSNHSKKINHSSSHQTIHKNSQCASESLEKKDNDRENISTSQNDKNTVISTKKETQEKQDNTKVSNNDHSDKNSTKNEIIEPSANPQTEPIIEPSANPQTEPNTDKKNEWADTSISIDKEDDPLHHSKSSEKTIQSTGKTQEAVQNNTDNNVKFNPNDWDYYEEGNYIILIRYKGKGNPPKLPSTYKGKSIDQSVLFNN